MTYKQAAQAALDVQDSCNLSGVAYAFGRKDGVMYAICNEARVQGQGTNWRNTNPIVTLFLLKMAELNGCGSTLDPSYGPAEQACREIAG